MPNQFHERNEEHFKAYLGRLPHALIISGLSASARRAAAEHLFEKLNQADVQTIDDESATLSIDVIRGLYTRIYRRTGNERLHIVHIIEAQRLTLPAQNALLKLLEEPPAHVKFILSSHHTDHLLPTIRSRSHVIELLPLSIEYFADQNQNLQTAKQQYLLSGGDPWLVTGFDGETDTEDLVGLGKRLLQLPLGSSLLQASILNKEPEKLESMLHIFGRIASTGLRHARNHKQRQQWLKRLEATNAALDVLPVHTNPKLLVDKLLLEFRTL